LKIYSVAIAAIAIFGIASAQKTEVKGQGQLNGGTAQFGTIYSLKNGFNFEILSAHYTLEPFNAYTPITGDTDKKILVLDIAIKNASKEDSFFSTDSMFTAVDDHGELSPGGSLMLESRISENSFTLKPGEGIGQPDLKNPLHFAIQVPAKAKITKLMINVGRLNTSEDVIRYMIALPPKDLDHPSDPNFIKPLPDNVRDPSDPYGAVALAQGKGAIGSYVPSGVFEIRPDAAPTDIAGQVAGADPDDGKKFISIPFTAKSMVSGDQSFFSVEGGGDPSYSLVNSDGDVIKAYAFLKASSGDSADKTFALGDEYHYRVVFEVPKDGKVTKLVYSTASSSVWALDLPQ
jgi:hypothetical protein